MKNTILLSLLIMTTTSLMAETDLATAAKPVVAGTTLYTGSVALLAKSDKLKKTTENLMTAWGMYGKPLSSSEITAISSKLKKGEEVIVSYYTKEGLEFLKNRAHLSPREKDLVSKIDQFDRAISLIQDRMRHEPRTQNSGLRQIKYISEVRFKASIELEALEVKRVGDAVPLQMKIKITETNELQKLIESKQKLGGKISNIRRLPKNLQRGASVLKVAGVASALGVLPAVVYGPGLMDKAKARLDNSDRNTKADKDSTSANGKKPYQGARPM
jgi:hypothetical protein